MKTHISILIAIALLISCENDINDTPDNFVVEAYLSANEPIDQITIKESFGLDIAEDPNVPIADAEVILTKNNGEFQLEFDPTTGSYSYIGNDLNVESGDSFGLRVSVDGRTATAQTIVPTMTSGLSVSTPQIVIPPIVAEPGIQGVIQDLFDNARFILNWENPDSDNHFIVVEKISGTSPIFPTDFPIPQGLLDLIQGFSTVSVPLTGSSYEIPALSLETYGSYRATVYRINDEYVELFESQATQDSRDLIVAPSNVDNALGIFTAIAGAQVQFEVIQQ